MTTAGRVRRNRNLDDDGVAAVEFALILPVLLLLVLGIINFGYLFGQKLALNQAVREGARQAVVPGTDEGADVEELGQISVVVKSSTGGLVDTSKVEVVVGGATVSSDADTTAGGCKVLDVGDSLVIQANYPASLLVPMPLPGFPNTFNLVSESVFRCEW